MPSDKVIPVRVALRCRPLVPKEEGEGCQCCLRFVPNEPQIILGKDKTFTYDYIFNPETPQGDVYEQTVSHLVEGLFEGYNATVLAYGQTGSGKTFTMGGSYGECSDPDDEVNGVIPRVIRDLFRGVDERQEDYTITVKVSYMELYKEDLHDLLQPASKREPVHIREEPTGGIKLMGLTERQVTSATDTVSCLEMGASSRTTGATAMNSQSSRSHAIFTLHVEKRSKVQDNDLCHAKFHLVDLAGSERAKKTQAEGERFKEGVNINKGLLALGNVISALGDEAQKRAHIPYRDSKLTRLLQDSLGGNSHTVMIACVSPADSNMEETLSTLRYADRARKIKNKPVINVDPQAAEIMRLRQIVQELQVQMVHGGGGTPRQCDSAMSIHGNMQQAESLRALKDRAKELEEEKYNLQKELRSTWAQNQVLVEQNIGLEISNEKLNNIVNIIKSKTGMSLTRLETTQVLNLTSGDIDTEDGDSRDDPLDMIRQIQDTIAQSEKEPADMQGSVYTGVGENVSPDTSITDEEQLSKQANFQRRLADLNDQLHRKEAVVKQMLQNDEAMDEMKKKYETDKTELSGQIERLNTEKTTLVQELETAKHSGNSASSKISEQRRKRLKELEEELNKARKTLRDQAKMVKMKDQSDQQLKTMTDDIRVMKQSRVKLLKQMKEEAEKFRQWKQLKDKEVIQLKAKDRKRQIEMVKLQKTNEKQQTVYRRKAEEAAAANKRLKDALLRQKAVQDERNKKQEHSDNTGIGGRVRKWLSQELEVVFSVEEAKRHLDGLKQDRADLVRQLKATKDKMENRPSPAKRRMSGDGSAEDTEKDSLNQQVQLLQAEVELRSAQISDLQEKVMDAGQEDKAKSRWQHIHTMVEAKCAMTFLMNETVNAKVNDSLNMSKLQEALGKYEDVTKQMEKLRNEHREEQRAKEEELLTMSKQHENKILYLLNQLQNANSSSRMMESADDQLKERLKFQEQEIERLANQDDQFEKWQAEKLELEEEVTRLQQLVAETPQDTKPPRGTAGNKYFSAALFKRPRAKESTKAAPVYSDEDPEEVWEEEEEDKDCPDDNWEQGYTPGYGDRKGEVKIRGSKRRTLTFKGTETVNSPNCVSPPKVTDKCSCKGKCIRCDCARNSRQCDDNCLCDRHKCRNRVKSTIPEEDEDNPEETTNVTGGTTLNSTFEVSSSTTAAVTSGVLQTSNDGVRPVTRRSTDKTTNTASALFKENVDAPDQKCDPLNGGLKKKRKLLNDGKGYFGPI